MTFSPVPIPLRWRRVHVPNATEGPSEMVCAQCRRALMPIVAPDAEAAAETAKLFPIVEMDGERVRDDEPGSAWVCFHCERAVVVTWGGKG